MTLLPPIEREPLSLKARRLSKKSDYVKGMMTIEDYLDRVDPYTSSTLKWPLPFDAKPASAEITQKVELHREEILNILDAHGFPPRAYFRLAVQTAMKRGYYSSKPKTLLSLTYMTDPYSTRAPQPPPKPTMDAARDDVASLLLERGINDISTEITFTNQAWNPILFDLPETNPLSQTFEYAIRPGVTNHILPNNTSVWQEVSLFYVGLTVEENYPTLVITVPPQGKGDWAALQEQINEFLVEKEKGELDVEFWPGPLKEVWDPDSEVVDEDDVDYQRVKTDEAQRNWNARRRPVLDKIEQEANNEVKDKNEGKWDDYDGDEIESGLEGFFIMPWPEEPEHERCLSLKSVLEDVLVKSVKRILNY
ncbi:hypothetical protein BDW72DRAFT_197503 [Aspergillus terricola var. indicus]